MKLTILVVTYGKDKLISETFRTLLPAIKGRGYSVIIYNNGPHKIKNHMKDIDSNGFYSGEKIKFIEDLNNSSLSIIYNNFLEKEDYDKFMILDDDTCIPEFFFDDIFNNESENSELILPVVYSKYNKKRIYPKNKDKLSGLGLQLPYGIFSVGSGLILDKKLINSFKKNNIKPFDERFALYGVDYSLFRRLRGIYGNSPNEIFYVGGFIYHSMSGVEKKIEPWREIERLYDHVLSIKYYSKFPKTKIIVLLLKKLFNFDFSGFKKILNIYYIGKHPRSK